jgi:hypothetical protein
MEALGAYLQQKMPGTAVRGRYFNELTPALDALRRSPPHWGIVSLGFFVEYAARLPMTPFASTRPDGAEKEQWRLVAGAGTSDDWSALTGKVTGTMLFTDQAAACLLFGRPVRALPFSLAGTSEPLRDLRAVARGGAPAMVLDQLQFETAQVLPAAADIKVLHVSADLPTSPVVWFGQPDASMRQLAAVLTAMRTDPSAAGLLQLLQTDGFGPADTALPTLRMPADGDCLH